MKGKKVVYIISDIEKSLGFEWMAQYLSPKIELFFLLIGKKDTPLAKALEKMQVRFSVISDDQYPSMLNKWLAGMSILRRERPDIIHAHLWRATLLGLTIGYLIRVPKRIFTRHHAMDHYRDYPGGRKWDVLCNWLATDIIAVSKNVKKILLERDGAEPAKVHMIHHGFNLAYFKDVDAGQIEEVRVKYQIQKYNEPIVGVVARYTEWKGIQFIIPAFHKLREKFPSAHLILANAHGDYKRNIQSLLKTLPEGSYTEIAFENNLSALYKLFHIYVHTPINDSVEAFGQTYVEALAAAVPSVFAISGIASEFIEHKQNAFVVPHGDSEAIAEGIREILSNSELSNLMKRQGVVSVEQFSFAIMLAKLESLYGK